MDIIINISLFASLAAIIYSLYLIRKINILPEGDSKMKEIAKSISEGARAYLLRQNKTVLVVALFIVLALWYGLNVQTAVGFLVGAFASIVAGFIGMNLTVKTNVRTTESARNGLAAALSVAFKGGSVTGLLVAGLALLSISAVLWFSIHFSIPYEQTLIALGFGGSLVSVFARLGGGIYTKGADVGTDMVGKIEKSIPEDDPRNPGVIADLVGDNVGDCAGMAADLFETYVVTLVSAIILGKLIYPQIGTTYLYPLLIGAVSLVASIVGTLYVRIGKDGKIMKALYKGFAATAVFSITAFTFLLIKVPPKFLALTNMSLFFAFLSGIIVTIGMVVITEYFTGKGTNAIKKLAESSITGHGTNIIAGLALSMKSTFAPIILISLAILFSYSVAGLYGIAIAAVSMLSMTGIIVSIDAFGPITDNAGGIAEMSGKPSKVRDITDALDAVGNTTKAVTKAYAIASAGLASLVLFSAYVEEISKSGEVIFSLSDPKLLVGLFIGASLPYLFASYAMEAVGKAASAIVEEIRRQFRDIKGIMTGKAKPDYAKCVDIVTRAALKEMFIPALLPVVAPILVGLVLGKVALGGLLMGVIITGLFVAISMTTGGAAWDNAKKYIEVSRIKLP